MRRFMNGALAAIFIATIPTVAAAQHRYSHRDRDHYGSNYCDYHPRDRDCRGFGPGDAAATIFGFAAGVAGAAANAAAGAGHVAACEARYRSYNSGTDMYMGYDGRRHYCRL